MFIVLLGNWEMKTYHYVTKSVNSPNADNIFGALMEAFTEDAVPWSNVICFCSDGANVMRGRNNSVLTRVLQKQPSTYAMYCPCHVLALCASKAASSFDDELQPLLVDIAYHFEHSPKRGAALEAIQKRLDLPCHKMVKPSTTRWLALEHSISRVLEQWRALKEFFAKGPSASTKQVKKILKAMHTPSTKAKMLFLQGALPVFTRLNLKLQQEGPMVHRLMDECEQATKTILLNVLRPEAVLSASSLASSHLLRQQNFLDLTKVTIGTATERYTERVFRSTDSKAEFLELCRDFWVVAAKEAQARLPLKDGVLKAARFLEPLRGNLIDGSTLVSLAEQFPQVIPSDQLDELRRQWQEYQVDADVSPADDVANFWKHVSGLLTSGSTRYSLVVKLAAAMLTIPHSSAGIERNFSQMGAAKTAGRNSISTEMLSSLMTIQCNRGNDTCLTFKPTPDMRRALPGAVARFAGRR